MVRSMTTGWLVAVLSVIMMLCWAVLAFHHDLQFLVGSVACRSPFSSGPSELNGEAANHHQVARRSIEKRVVSVPQQVD